MKLNRQKIFIYLLIFLTSALLIGFSIVVNIGLVGLPENLSNLIVFISIAFITFYARSRSENLLSPKSVFSSIILAWIFLFLPKALNSSFTFTLASIPFFVSFLMGITAGNFYYRRRSFKLPILVAFIPLTLAFGLGALWNSKVIYGSSDGETQGLIAPAFNITNKSGGAITNDSTRGQIVLMDFWFISCPPCWVKFPELQRIYDQYKTDDRIAIYAVNRPMKTDKPDQLYTSIEKKQYTFPVVKGSEELMTAFEIDYYPTIVIIDPMGDIVFKGGIEHAQKVIENVLNE